MTSKNIILAGAIAIGVYLLSQAKKIPFITGAQKTTPDTPSATTPTVRQRTAQKIAQKVAQEVAQKVAQVDKNEYVRERALMNKAIPIRSKKIARKIPSVGTSAARRRMAEKIAYTRAQKIREQKAAEQRAMFSRAAQIRAQMAAEQRAAAARKAAARKKAADSRIYTPTKTTPNPYSSSFPATGPKNIVHITPTRQKIMQKISQRIAEKTGAPWKAPLIWSPKPKFRVITPSDILRNFAIKDIARKKAVQQKTSQKTTPDTPSARRKRRLQALYGSHWKQVWIERPRRR